MGLRSIRITVGEVVDEWWMSGGQVHGSSPAMKCRPLIGGSFGPYSIQFNSKLQPPHPLSITILLSSHSRITPSLARLACPLDCG
jgi:hypothetical protein